MSTYPIVRNDLHFALDSHGSYVCQELQELPQRFASLWSTDQVRAAIESLLSSYRSVARVRLDEDERARVSEETQVLRGMEIFDTILADLRQKVAAQGWGLFHEFLFWLGYWWYYHPELRRQVTWADRTPMSQGRHGLIQQWIVPVLPDQVRSALGGAEPLNAATDFGRFALLFDDEQGRRRFIVTDQRLVELRDVYGYAYLDVTPDGHPIARCCTDRGGERAFFDGVRLMSHERFCTCAPKTVIVEGGYKVNSTGVTIINGELYPLIDVDDAVSHSTGTEFFLGMPMCKFSNAEGVRSYELSEASGTRIRVAEGVVTLDGTALKRIGEFAPSQVELLDSGFALYHWADFVEIPNFHYQHVLAVDDREDWLQAVQSAFGPHIARLETLHTSDKRAALTRILADQPAAILLDLHLTPEEEFDGLWIATQLARSGYRGLVCFTSNTPREALTRLASCVPGRVRAPGKDLERVRRCLLEAEDTN